MGIFSSRQFVLFVVTGGVAALVNLFSRFVYNEYVGFSAAILLAYLTGMITAFVLAKIFVFKDGANSLQKSAAYFCLVNVLAVAQTWFISMWLAHYVLPWCGVKNYVPEIAHVIGVIVPVFSSYLGHKHFSFR